jgi:predicted regulator of Ras-like GTPase activity (Roadblock/LC7/MglB family)
MVGQLVPDFDVTSFVSLSASDFAATQELARLVGEESFRDVFHQGRTHSIYISQVADGHLLALLFDRNTTLGLVRHALRKARPRLEAAMEELAQPEQVPAPEGVEKLAEDVDRLWDEPPST